jgi:hypothetical protein
VFWDRLAAAVTARRSWLIALAVMMIGGAMIGLAGANEAGTQSPEFLPTSTEAARADAAVKQFPAATGRRRSSSSPAPTVRCSAPTTCPRSRRPPRHPR